MTLSPITHSEEVVHIKDLDTNKIIDLYRRDFGIDVIPEVGTFLKSVFINVSLVFFAFMLITKKLRARMLSIANWPKNIPPIILKINGSLTPSFLFSRRNPRCWKSVQATDIF
jgi:hypothetical protein